MSNNDSHNPRREGRPIPVPPALFSASEPFEGYDILDELRSPAGVVIWQALRDVVVWATTPKQFRELLFSRDAYDVRIAAIRNVEIEGNIRKWILLLAGVVSGNAQPRREEIARACRRMSRWAEHNTLPRTAIWYAQAASMSEPANAEHAYTTAVLLRQVSESARAEAWYRRAIGLARRRRDTDTYARACLGLGNLFMQRGEYAKAKVAFERGFRTARRAGIRKLRAEALHDLFTVAVETDQVAEAELLARRALRAYPRSHPRIPALAHDVAVFWLLHGLYWRALPVLQAVAQVIVRPKDRLMVLSNLVRAAGGAGRIDVFAIGWSDTWQIIDAQPDLECVTSSLLRLAYGSLLLRDWERVDLAARYASELAARRGQKTIQKEADALLRAAVQQDVSELPSTLPASSPSVDDPHRIAGEFVRRLAACAGGQDRPRLDC